MSKTPAKLVAEALTTEIHDQLGDGRGIIYYSPPRFDPDHFVKKFNKLTDDLGIAFVGLDQTPTEKTCEEVSIEIRTGAIEGVKWRNANSDTEGVPSNIVILVRGEQTATNSIQDIHGVHDFDGDPLRRLWKIGASQLNIDVGVSESDSGDTTGKTAATWEALWEVFIERNTRESAQFIADIQECLDDGRSDDSIEETTDDTERSEEDLLCCIGNSLPTLGLFAHQSLAERDDPAEQIQSNYQLCDKTIPEMGDDDEEVLINNLVEWSETDRDDKFDFEITDVVNNILEFRDHKTQEILSSTDLDHIRKVLEPIEGIAITEPVAEFSYAPPDPDADEEVTFDASESYVVEGSIHEYRWDFTDDGVTDEIGEEASYSFSRGRRQVTLTVEDNQGLTDSKSEVISVGDIVKPPSADFSYNPPEPEEGEEVTFDAEKSSPGTGDITTYEWNFTGGETVDAIGETTTHSFDEEDRYEVKLVVRDENDESDSESKTIVVENEVTNETHQLPEYGIDAAFEDFDAYDNVIADFISELSNYVENDDEEARSGTLTVASNGVQINVQNDEINPEFWNVLKEFTDKNEYGGEIHTDDHFELLQPEYSKSDTDTYILWGEKIKHLRDLRDESGIINELITELDKYEELRAEISQIALGLYCKPLSVLVASAEDDTALGVEFKTVQEYIETYQSVQERLIEFYDELGSELGLSESKRILSQFLSLDTVVVKQEDGESPTQLTFTPLHPLYLWKYVRLTDEIIREDGVHEDEDVKQFLKTAIEDRSVLLPTFTLLGDHDNPDSITDLVHSRYITNTPVYTDPAHSAPGSNIEMWKKIVPKLLRAHPPARGTLNVSIIDPVAPGELLKRLTDFVGVGNPVQRANIEIAFINSESQSIYSGLNTRSKNNLIEELRPDRQQGPYEVSVYASADDYGEYARERLREKSRHLVLVNDSSSLTFDRQPRPEGFEIHPLSVPAEFQYQRLAEQFAMTPAPEGEVFVNYLNVIAKIGGFEENQLAIGRHDLKIETDQIETFERYGVWICLSTPEMSSSEPFPILDSLISRQQIGDRDYAIYSKYRRRFVNILVRILQSYDMEVTGDEVETLVDSVPNFEETGLMNLLTKDLFEKGAPRIQKGILGAIIATRWLQSDDHPSLVLSIDEPMARKWLNLRNTNQRADFLLIRLVDEEIELDIVEAKAHDDPENVFSVAEPDEEGGEPIVSGKAVRQLGTTRKTLEAIFAGDDSLATNSRKEVLRKQIYYALRQKQDIENGKQWEEALNSFFDAAGSEDNVRSRIVSVELNRSEGSEAGQSAVTESGDDIILDRLRKDIVSELIGRT
jgi:PKD repeat protein